MKNMKNKKLIILLPMYFIVFALVIVKVFGVSYSASTGCNGQDGKYCYIRRNMLSHHYIKHKFTSASGTFLIKTGDPKKANEGQSEVVYCAEEGMQIKSGAATKYSIDATLPEGTEQKLTTEIRTKLKAFLPYVYPYSTLTEIKNALKDSSIGLSTSDYSKYNFENLTAQESITAAQISIWDTINSTDKYVPTDTKAIKTISYDIPSLKINWNSCAGYNTGSDRYATILTSEDQQWYSQSGCDTSGNFYKYVYGYDSKEAANNRINTLVSWYRNLFSKVTPINNIAKVTVKDSNCTSNDGNSTLTCTVVIDSEEKNYAITFYDYSGSTVLTTQNATGTKGGNTYTISNLPITTTGIRAHIKVDGATKSVYYYSREGQDFIGVDTRNTPYEADLNIPNEYEAKGKIILYKVKGESSAVELTYDNSTVADSSKCGSGCLSGAHFILYASDKKTIIKDFISTTSSTVIPNLSNGTYYLYEENPPYGYNRFKNSSANVDSDGYIKIDITDGKTASVKITNDQTKICFMKVDSATGEPIDDAKLRIEDAEGSGYEEWTTSTQDGTNHDGSHCLVGQLEPGYYYLLEDAAPPNYIKTNKLYKFAVGSFDANDIVDELEESETVVKIESANGVVKLENKAGTVITKSDLATGGCVAGAELTITDETGKVVEEWTSSCDDGKENHQVDLKPGKYTLTEKTAPEGYASSESITFTIDENGKADTSLDMKDAPIEACFLKVSKDSEEGLIGAEFEIYKEDGTLYDTFTSDYTATCFPYMPVGNYILKETKAPEGYQQLKEDVKITVKDTAERQVFEINNELEVPKTDISSSQIILVFAAIFMTFGLGLVGYYAYKRKI